MNRKTEIMVKAEKLLLEIKSYCINARLEAERKNFDCAKDFLCKAEFGVVRFGSRLMQEQNSKMADEETVQTLSAYYRQAKNTYEAHELYIERKQRRGLQQ